jgi:hypothetical protein
VISIYDAVDKQLGLKIEPRDIATAVPVRTEMQSRFGTEKTSVRRKATLALP